MCGAQLTFYLQVRLPWFACDSIVALFQCTACIDEQSAVPEMLAFAPGRSLDVPRAFLERYQTNFRLLRLLPGEVELRDPIPRTIRPCLLAATTGRQWIVSTGGQPEWLQDDETPASLDGRTVHWKLLFQMRGEIEFPRDAGAPGQMEADYISSIPRESEMDFYRCFLGNAVYVFGLEDQPDLLYVTTQRP